MRRTTIESDFSRDGIELRITENFPLGSLTSLKLGGIGRALASVSSTNLIEDCHRWARANDLPILHLGSGTNILVQDRGFSGLVLKNEFRGIDIQGREVEVGSGERLDDLVLSMNRKGLAGLERLYGIPGTVAGAVVGNAGAYGQEISGRLVWTDVWHDGRVQRMPADSLAFRYRHSLFKDRRDWFLTRCGFRLFPSGRDLQSESDEIRDLRLKKYPPDLKCPGSLFKNIEAAGLDEETLQALPEGSVRHGKVPAGLLLQAVGANGARRGDARVADYHGNLFINDGNARALDVLELARSYADLVRDRFGVRLEPEILILGEQGPMSWP